MKNDLCNSISNEKTKIAMNNIFQLISSSASVNTAIEKFKSIINEEIKKEHSMRYILQSISTHLTTAEKLEKKEILKLVSAVTQVRKDVEVLFPYVSQILAILQSMITDDCASLFTNLSKTYADLVENCLKNEITDAAIRMNRQIDDNAKRIYELFQGFCIYNMKQEAKANQVCGSLCLSSLVESCPLVLQPEYLKYIWENVVMFINIGSFYAKLELLNCLVTIIFASESSFSPFATITFYQVLDFLTDNDWLKRKLALNVVYSLVFYCHEEIMPLKNHIIEFLMVLKLDQVREVREVCFQTLRLLNGNNSNDDFVQIQTEEETSDRKIKEKKSSNSNTNMPLSRSLNLSKNPTNIKDKDNPKPSNVLSSTIPEKKYHVDKCDKNNLNNKEELRPVNNNHPQIKMRSSTPNKLWKNTSTKSILLHNRSPESSIGNIPRDLRNSAQELKIGRKHTSKMNLNVNRNKDDNTFVNSKMVIKSNPGYSIFKTNPNRDFFKKEKGIEVVVVGQSKEFPREVLVFTEDGQPKGQKTNNNNTNENEEKRLQRSGNEERKCNDDLKLSMNVEEINNMKSSQEGIQCKGLGSSQCLHMENANFNEILKQMTNMSEKQIVLIDTIEKIQASSQDQINIINSKIRKIETAVDKILGVLKGNHANDNYSFPFPRDDVISSSIMQQIRAQNPTEAFKIALQADEVHLINLIATISIPLLKEVNEQVIEDTMSRLIILLAKGESITTMTRFIKNVLMWVKPALRLITYQNLKDILHFLSTNRKKLRLKEEEIADIDFIFSHLLNSLSKETQFSSR